MMDESPSSVERVSALLDAVMSISSDLDLPSTLTRIVQAACRLANARYGALGVLSPDGTRLSQFVTEGVSDELRARIGDPPAGSRHSRPAHQRSPAGALARHRH